MIVVIRLVVLLIRKRTLLVVHRWLDPVLGRLRLTSGRGAALAAAAVLASLLAVEAVNEYPDYNYKRHDSEVDDHHYCDVAQCGVALCLAARVKGILFETPAIFIFLTAAHSQIVLTAYDSTVRNADFHGDAAVWTIFTII